MNDLTNYPGETGALSLAEEEFNTVDALAVACICYLDFDGMSDGKGWTMAEAERLELIREGTGGFYPARRELFRRMAASKRFGDCRIRYFINLKDDELRMQFAALCLELTDGTTCVAFRGTDNTLTGWHENFDMAYLKAVPAQKAATRYLAKVAEIHDRPLRILGHSKGGNLAIYASSTADAETLEQIREIYCFDGPGLSDEMFASEGFAAIRSKLYCCFPQTGIIGRLMNYPENAEVIRSAADGIRQHDAFTWEITDTELAGVEKPDPTSDLICETLHEWLDRSTDEQRAAFVSALFQLVDPAEVTHVSDLGADRLKTLMTAVGRVRDVDPETRRVFARLSAQFLTLGAGNVIERIKDTPIANAAENVWEWAKGIL